jgi:hypothetical protein
MASKRQPSKQRRQSQNQKQRAALDARREAAATARQTADVPPEATDPSDAGTGSVLSRFRGAASAGRTARTGGTGVPVGHRAALSALLAAVAAAVVGSLLFNVPVDRSGEVISTRGALVGEWTLTAQEALDDAPADATPEEIATSIDDWLPAGTEPYIKAFWPLSAAVVLPVIGTALGLRAVSRRSPAKVVNRTMYVTLFGALLTQQLLIIFLPAVISLAVAAFQVRKAEVAAAQAAPADDVIDVDEVDEDIDDDVNEAEVVEDEVAEDEVVEVDEAEDRR